jgi:hypothetical protein
MLATQKEQKKVWERFRKNTWKEVKTIYDRAAEVIN